LILDHARRDPNGLALDDGVRRRSWAELADRTTRIARWLREEMGLAPGDHVACLLGNRVEGIELVVGAVFAGVWLTPINHHLAAEEIAYVVADSGARVLLADAAHAEVARRAGAPALVEVGDELDAALARASDAPMDLDGPAGGNMIYTSGTTGRPKGVKRRPSGSLRAALAAQAAYGRRIGLDGSGPHLVTGPLHHSAPLMFAVYDQACGAPVLVMPRWDERLALRAIQEREVHHTHLVPTMFVRLLRLPEDERARFRAPALHTVLHGAAPVAPALKRAMIAWWGPILLEYWGGTEGGVTTLVGSEEWLAHPGTVGRAVPHFEVFAVDDAGRRLPPGAEGTLYSRHRSLPHCFEYHGDARKTAEAFLDASAFTLGDVGRVDADGFVYLADRRSHTIISGGVNVYPAEIEHVLQEHPAVADVAVFGVPDAEWGESVKAAVQLEPGSEPSRELERELLAHARARLAGYKVPRSIDFERELPRTPAGKLAVRRLRERYWRDLGRRI
jgi:long-chain acyl-CoA synthetase